MSSVSPPWKPACQVQDRVPGGPVAGGGLGQGPTGTDGLELTGQGGLRRGRDLDLLALQLRGDLVATECILLIQGRGSCPGRQRRPGDRINQ